jgi:hypothetical protein
MSKHVSKLANNISAPELMFSEDLHAALQGGCHECGEAHDEFYFHSRCHPNSPNVEAHYIDRVLRLACAVCGKPICDIVPASNKPRMN